MGLTLLGLLGVSLLYGGIDRLKRTKTPPFSDEGHMYSTVTFLPKPSNPLLQAVDNVLLRITLWMLVPGIPLAAGIACFQKERTFLGVALLAGWSSGAAVLGLWIWLYAMFHALST